MQNPNLVESVFSKAAQMKDTAERDSYLDEACRDDAELRIRVEALLRANSHTDGFLNEPIGVVQMEEVSSNSAQERSVLEKPGDSIGPYKLLQEIGEGGMGVVFMAEQREPVRRKVALKIVKPGLDTKEVIARFEAERQALALMDHPNIARVLEAGAVESGRPFFVMDLVHGVPITEYCNQAKLSTRDRLNLFLPVCEAVQHAHQKGVIHRDIKPSNILVTLQDGKPVPKVIDFGIAKAIDCPLTDKTLFTRFGEFIGTPAYMSPEQTQMSGLDVDTRSDIYSLGALLYELLTGSAPFDATRVGGVTQDELVRIIRDEEPAKPSAFISTLGAKLPTVAEHRNVEPQKLEGIVRGELDWIVMQAMDKDRTRRYDSASAFSDDVERFLNQEIVLARPPSTVYRIRKMLRRHWVAVTFTTAFVFVLIAATAVSGWLAWKASQAAELANQRFIAETAARREADEERANARNAQRQASAAAKNAEQKAAISTAVLDFLNEDLLAQASPSSNPNRNIRLRTVLDRAAASIDSKFANQPIVEATVRSTIGETYRKLSEFALAERHLIRAWDLYRDTIGTDREETIAAANRLVRLKIDQAKFADADRLLSDAIRSGRNSLGTDHAEVITSLYLAGHLRHAQGRFDEAENYFLDVVAKRRRRDGENHPDTLMAMNNLAFVYMSQLRYDKARPILSLIVERVLQQHDEWHPDTITVINNLAALHRSQGRFEEARILERQVYENAKAVFGDEHQTTLVFMNNLAMSYYQDEDFAQAEPLFLNVLAAQKRRLGEQHPDTLTTSHNLASLYQDLNRPDDAEPLYRKTWRQRVKVLGENHPDTLTTLNNLAYFYLDAARFKEAAPLYQQASRFTEEVFGNDHPNTAISLLMHGYCELRQGEAEEAEEIFRRVLSFPTIENRGHWLRYAVEGMWGEALLELGRTDDAVRPIQTSYQGLSNLRGQMPKQWSRFGLDAARQRLVKLSETQKKTEEPLKESKRANDK